VSRALKDWDLTLKDVADTTRLAPATDIDRACRRLRGRRHEVKLMPFEPVILFFLLGLRPASCARILKIPGVVYEALSIFLLLAIGLKGGVELARHDVLDLALPAWWWSAWRC
jgi:hypothetical protein